VFREDASNADIRIVRNALRHQLMPVVQELAPGSVRALARLAELSTEDEAFLTSSARAHATLLGLLRNDADGVQLDRGRLNALPRALARRVVRDAIEAADAPVTSRHIEDVLRLSGSRRLQGHLDLTGLSVEIDDASVILRRRATGITPVPGFEYALPVPGVVEISETCGRIEASYREMAGADRGLCGAAVAIVQASALHLPLVVRNRRPGDRLRPLGAPGSRKLQDVLVDRKVARLSRDSVPVVADARGAIVWVAGITVADHCRVTAPEAGVVILKFKGPRD
jgi:tRNA(Ile)-lysidine synthase